LLDFLGLTESRGLAKRLGEARTDSIGVSGRRQASERVAEGTRIAEPVLSEIGYDAEWIGRIIDPTIA